MRFVLRAFFAAAAVAVSGASALLLAHAQEPVPTPVPAPPPATAPATEPAPVPADASAPVAAPAPGLPAGPDGTGLPAAPAAAPSARIVDTGTVSIAKLPSENPFGGAADVPATLPPRLNFTDAVVNTGFFVSVRVDATGKPLSVRRDRDPIPSLAAESMKSIQRWTITPARRSGQSVETWGAYRLELAVEVDAPKITQMLLMPITPVTPLPAPFAWPPDAEWLDGRKPAAPSDGTVSILEVDTAPVPTKTPWSADSFKGPFSARYWIKINKNGLVERAIPLEVSDPVLLVYLRKSMNSWVFKPATAKGAPVDSWNELSISGQISFDPEIKQISALRRAIGP